jgi:hypothetical protein
MERVPLRAYVLQAVRHVAGCLNARWDPRPPQHGWLPSFLLQQTASPLRLSLAPHRWHQRMPQQRLLQLLRRRMNSNHRSPCPTAAGHKPPSGQRRP